MHRGQGAPLDLYWRQTALAADSSQFVGNAIKFTPSGLVTINTILESTDADRTTLHFIVADTGIGIPEDKLSLIFNSFEQADISHTRQYGGTGLGLSISKQLVALMGGRIWVESQVGVGSAFHFTVTLESSAEHLPTKDLGKERYSDEVLKGLRILIVDDNELNRDVACMMLEQDHLVTTANNGREALAALAVEDFDVILMDVQMPEMDGLAATAIIRALERGSALPQGLSEAQGTSLANKIKGRHVPIIAMTAHAMREDQERCLTAGMDEYISKPFQYDRLVAVLRKLIPVSLLADNQPGGISAETIPSPPMAEEVARYLKSTTHLTDEKIANLLSAARRNLVDLLDNAENALLEKDYQKLKLTAHSLKGTLLQCGLVDWAEKAQEMYTHAQDTQEFPFAELLQSIKKGINEFLSNPQ